MDPTVRRLLDFIGSKEAPKGYTDYYRGVSLSPPRPLTSMTLDEVMSWQRKANPPGPGTAAVGKYQFIHSTLKWLKSRLGLAGSEKFDAQLQDRLAVVLLARRGLRNWLAGEMTTNVFINNLAAEWASLPMATGPKAGRSRYDGDGVNSALCTVEELKEVLEGPTVTFKEPEEVIPDHPSPQAPPQNSGLAVLIRIVVSIVKSLIKSNKEAT